MNTSNSDNVIVNSILPRINVQTKSSFNTLNILQTETDTESSISINNEIFDENNISEEISSHQKSAEVIDHTCDDNGKNLISIKEESGVTSIHSINATNDISMKGYGNFIHKYYASFLSSKNHKDLFSVSEYDSDKWRVCRNENIILDVLLNKSKSFECQVSLLFFVIGNKKFSSHMDQISEHINSSNHKIHSYDQIRKSIVNLGSNKCENNNNSTFQISCLQNLLLMSIFDTPEKYLSNVDCKSDMIKVRTSSVSHHQQTFLVQYVQCII